MTELIEKRSLELTNEMYEEIHRLGSGTMRLWTLFILCMAPAILNGFHMSSYVFLSEIPGDDMIYCIIPKLIEAGWSKENIKNISTRDVGDVCNVLNWDYDLLSGMSFEEALKYVETQNPPEQVFCKKIQGSNFDYLDSTLTIVAEWDLICDREALRPTVQTALSIGKFIGAFLFGIVADKYGRKTSVTIGAILYILFGPLAAFSKTYWFFILCRVLIGVAGSAVYHSAYTIITEFAAPNLRSYVSVAFSVVYPIGMIIMAGIAYFIRKWRLLQLGLSLPALLLVIHYMYFDESARWLISKGKIPEAYKIVFRKSLEPEECKLINNRQKEIEMENAKKWTFKIAMKKGIKELSSLYGRSTYRKWVLVCHFSWFTASLAYYVLALNGDNFLADQYVYITVTGLTEIPSYFIPMILFKFTGRKISTSGLMITSGLFLLFIMAVPRDMNNIIISMAIFGRTCISASFSIVILHTAELFPTYIRSSAIGTSSTMAHIGSIAAPYISDLVSQYGWFIPTTICGIICIVSAILIIFILPETKNVELDENLEAKSNDTQL